MTEYQKYSRFEVEKVRSGADIRLFIPNCDLRKTTQEVKCPFCGEKKLSVVHKKGKNFAHCFHCKEGFSSPIDAYMHYNGLAKDRFVEALEDTARIGGIVIIPEERVRQNAVRQASDTNRSTFCRRQLEASGLTEEDVTAHVLDGTQDLYKCPFSKGRLDDNFRPTTAGDDMLIYYYDLNGRPMQYKVKGSATPRQYVRVRWANPAIHSSRDGKEMKYQTPPGATCRVYIPERIRKAYQNKTHLDTLFLQEGEKKAEKACKHGMMSIGIQGINNFGSAQEGLLQDIQDIATACTINNIVLVMDSDWNCLHKNLTIGDQADKRPNSFAKAVIKFRQYMSTFHNLKLNVDIWWGHINENQNGDKGVDDLLCGSLKGREQELLDDIDTVMHTHDGKGKWIDIHKITAVSDMKICDFWLLNDRQAFYELHRSRLDEVATFKLGGIRYKVEDGKIVPLSRYAPDIDIYSVSETSKGERKVSLNYNETFNFLNASGFYRLRNSEDAASGYDLIRIDDGIIDRVASYEVRDFVRQYVFTNCKSGLVLEFFKGKIDQLLPDKKLESLDILSDNFNNFERDIQRTYYNNGQVEITSDSIVPGKPISNVWRSRIVPRKFRRIEIISSIEKVGDRFYLSYSEDARNCEFLHYLINTSNNFYPHDKVRDLSENEDAELAQHVVNKITTIGYLLCDWKYASERKAVVVQDHLMTEVGQSQGGAGKSVVGNAIGKILDQFTIDGKAMKADDEFMLSGVTKATRNIFIDDVKTNFNFERLFAMVTGDMSINPKGRDRYNIKVADSPKILITTNHAINKANENATKRRITYMEFSTWYNPNHTLIDDFHHMFFDDWDDYQWALFDNLMAECVMFYLRSFERSWSREGQGAVPPPMKNIEQRALRQEMSEIFFKWAEEFFDFSGNNLNERLRRNDLVPLFFEYAGGPSGHGVTRSNFRKKVEAYCKFKGYDFNINKPDDEKNFYSDWKPSHPDESFIGGDDKSGGTEYYTVWSPEYEKTKKPF